MISRVSKVSTKLAKELADGRVSNGYPFLYKEMR